MDILWIIVVILILMWAVGLGVGYTLGGLVHVLLVIAIIVIIVRLITGRRAI